MAVDSTTRRVVYAGNGKTTAFPFVFKVFEETDVVVAVGDGDSTSSTLAYGTDFSVALNSDQETNPGGTVTVKTAPKTGANLAITSGVPYDQPMKLTPYDGFNPETLNDNSDRQCIQIQQLVEQVGRAITTDTTDSMSAAELKQKLLDAADSAFEVATQQAAAAAKSAEEAKGYRDEILEHQNEIVAAVTAEGDKQDARLIAEGDTQVARIQAETDNTLIANGMGGGEKAWALSAAVAAGTAIEIPGGLKYIVNRHHLRVSWNGLVCHLGVNFNEIGDEDTYSTTFKLTFDAAAGDEIDVWIGALGKGEVADAIALAGEASAAVAELSRKVVYKEET